MIERSNLQDRISEDRPNTYPKPFPFTVRHMYMKWSSVLVLCRRCNRTPLQARDPFQCTNLRLWIGIIVSIGARYSHPIQAE